MVGTVNYQIDYPSFFKTYNALEGSNFDNLPPELVEKIFSYIPQNRPASVDSNFLDMVSQSVRGIVSTLVQTNQDIHRDLNRLDQLQGSNDGAPSNGFTLKTQIISAALLMSCYFGIQALLTNDPETQEYSTKYASIGILFAGIIGASLYAGYHDDMEELNQLSGVAAQHEHIE